MAGKVAGITITTKSLLDHAMALILALQSLHDIYTIATLQILNEFSEGVNTNEPHMCTVQIYKSYWIPQSKVS